jgi:hypothetical protein
MLDFRRHMSSSPILRVLGQAFCVGIVLFQMGCNETPTAPSSHPAVGDWSGVLVDRIAGQGNLRLNLRYDAATDTVGGVWTVSLARGGTVQGRATVWAKLEPFVPLLSCGETQSAGGMNLAVDPDRLHGSFFFFSNQCPPLDSGTLDVTRQ